MVLHHVPQGAGALVVAGPVFDPHRFSGGDLDVGDVVAVPDRLEDRVGEAHHQDVLDRFLAQVVVDAEDLALLGAGLHHLVELLGAAVVATEGLLDHHPAALGVGQQARRRQGAAAAAVELRRHRQVEGAIAAGGPQPIDDLKALAQPHQVIGLLQIHRLIEQALGELLPGAGVIGDLAGEGHAHFRAEFLVAPGPAGAAEHGELTGQAPLAEQLEQGWHQLAVGEIAAGPEDDDALGGDHPLLAQTHPQRIGEQRGHGAKGHRVHSGLTAGAAVGLLQPSRGEAL